MAYLPLHLLFVVFIVSTNLARAVYYIDDTSDAITYSSIIGYWNPLPDLPSWLSINKTKLYYGH